MRPNLTRRSARAAVLFTAATATLLTACAETSNSPLEPTLRVTQSIVDTEHLFASGLSPVTTWNPIYPTTPYWNWPAQCTSTPAVGPNANWENEHAAFVFSPYVHPWETSVQGNFEARWINAWSHLGSLGAHGQSWTKYATTVEGTGQFVVRFLADNCSWIYLDDTLIGVQDDNWASSIGAFPLTLDGTHTLTFIILDGGGLAGGKFRLETRSSYGDGPLEDATAPQIAPQVTGDLGNGGWYTSDIGVAWTVTDDESAITSQTGCSATSVTSDTEGVTFTCTATSSGGTASESVTVKRDATAPSIVFTGNSSSYDVSEQVAITCSVTDATSDVAASACAGANADAYTFGAGAETLGGSAEDNAGNTVTASTQFSVTVSADGLCALTQRWVSKAGVANALCKQLANDAINAYVNTLEAQRGKSITVAKANILIGLAAQL